MRLRLGSEFAYESPAETPAVMLVRPHEDAPHRVVEEYWGTVPATVDHAYRDHFGNHCRRFGLPAGMATMRYDAVVEISGDPDPVGTGARQVPVAELPDETLVFTLASRYCHADALSNVAWGLFGGSDPGWSRVQAICDWINTNIRYGIPSNPLTSATDVYVAGGGMCRDFAHLAITFCRALNIPARYVFGYMPDIGVPGPFPPMDFHAWFEAYLDDRWWTFDARFNIPRIGRVPIGRGRDAVDVAMVTTYGAARFRRMVVWTDQAADDATLGDDPTATHPDQAAPETSEALLVGHGGG